MELKANFSFLLAPVLLLFSFGITAPFYPIWMAAGGAIFATLLPLLSRGNTLPVLLALGSFFGNHPGGRGLEFFDLALLSALLFRLPDLKSQLQTRVGSLYGRFILLLVFSTAFSYLGAYYLLESFEGYRILPYHFLSARDWLPHYSFKVAATNVICAVLVIEWALAAREGKTSTHFGASFLLLALLIPATVGILELLPPVALSLDRYHIWLDGYVDRTAPHQFLFLPALFEHSPNSLFWNRSWFALYLISVLPAAGIALQFLPGPARLPGRKLGVPLFLCLGTLMGFLFLSIGARAGILSFLVFLAVLLLLLAIPRHRKILAWTMVIAMTVLLLATPLIAFWSPGQSLLEERAELYRSGIQIFLQSPVFGTGVESFGFYNDLILRGAGYQRVYSSTHNFLLQLGGGMGLAGVSMMALFLFFAFRSSIQGMSNPQTAGSLAPIVYFAGALAFLFYGNFQELWYLRGIQLNWWLMVFGSIIWHSSQKGQCESENDAGRLRQNRASSTFARIFPRTGKAVIAGGALLFLCCAFSIYRGISLGDRWSLFENVGHLQPIPESTESGYALLQGDGSYLKKENGSLVPVEFECRESDPPLSGPPDPRRICRYESVAPENVAQELPPGLR